ncbi:hypothetical protein J2T13_000130 [Paenibacillus sp. DS2015]
MSTKLRQSPPHANPIRLASVTTSSQSGSKSRSPLRFVSHDTERPSGSSNAKSIATPKL